MKAYQEMKLKYSTKEKQKSKVFAPASLGSSRLAHLVLPPSVSEQSHSQVGSRLATSSPVISVKKSKPTFFSTLAALAQQPAKSSQRVLSKWNDSVGVARLIQGFKTQKKKDNKKAHSGQPSQAGAPKPKNENPQRSVVRNGW